MLKRRYQYEALMKLPKLSLLIISSAANIECGFSVLTFLSTKLCNSLAPKTLDKFMRIVLIGPYGEESDLDKVVDLHKFRKKRRMNY